MWLFCGNCDLCMKKVGENIKRHFFGTRNYVCLWCQNNESFFSVFSFFPSALNAPPQTFNVHKGEFV